NYADVMLQKRMIEGSRPKEETVRKIWDAARGLGSGSAGQLAAVCGVHPADAQAAMKLLESAGHLARRGQDFSVLTPEVEEPAVDFELAEMARGTRVPPYVVFHDATLRELASALPQDERGFLAVKGAGPSRWQRYGERVLAVTRKGRRAQSTPDSIDEPPQGVSPSQAEE